MGKAFNIKHCSKNKTVEFSLDNRNNKSMCALRVICNVDDFDKFVKDKAHWHVYRDNRGHFSVRTNRRRVELNSEVLLHRCIYKEHDVLPEYTGEKCSIVVDHINNNPLDNRMGNLNLLSVSENSKKQKYVNRSLFIKSRRTKSGYPGISLSRNKSGFQSYHNGRYLTYSSDLATIRKFIDNYANENKIKRLWEFDFNYFKQKEGGK